MPLIFEKQLEHNTALAVWHIEEQKDFFAKELQLLPEENRMLDLMKPHRRKEWMTSRFLADRLCPSECRISIVKDSLGKPKLEDHSHHISISHSRDRVAVIRSDAPVGIDIQHHEEKIVRIKHKFISPQEMAQIDTENAVASFHLFWSSKECMYKAWGKRELDFRRDMHLFPFRYYQPQLELAGKVEKDGIVQDHHIFSDKLDNYYLCYSILKAEHIRS